MIYFVQPTDGGPVKIGCSSNVPIRVKQLEAHYGRPLALLATIDGGRSKESELHRRFAHLRLGRTEQFRPAAELMAFINRPLFVNQGDVELIPSAGAGRQVVTNVRSSAEWKSFVEEFADWDRAPSVSDLVDRAIAAYARERRYSVLPPKR